MKLDKSFVRTVLVALGVVSFVIGVYQTLLQRDLRRNYWIFMVSLACWLPLNYWRQQDARRAREAQNPPPPSTTPRATQKPGKRSRRR